MREERVNASVSSGVHTENRCTYFSLADVASMFNVLINNQKDLGKNRPWLDETRHVCTARRFFICLWKIFSVYNKSDILTTLFVLTEETWKFIKHVLINTWWFFYSSPPLSRHNKTNCKSHSDCCRLIVVNSYWLHFKSLRFSYKRVDQLNNTDDVSDSWVRLSVINVDQLMNWFKSSASAAASVK